MSSDFRQFRTLQGLPYIYGKVPHSGFELGVPDEYLLDQFCSVNLSLRPLTEYFFKAVLFLTLAFTSIVNFKCWRVWNTKTAKSRDSMEAVVRPRRGSNQQCQIVTCSFAGIQHQCKKPQGFFNIATDTIHAITTIARTIAVACFLRPKLWRNATMPNPM